MTIFKFHPLSYMLLKSLVFAFYYGIVFLVRHKRRDRKIENTALLCLSYLLYIKLNPIYVFLLLGITWITYYFGILVEESTNYRKRYFLS